MGSLQAVDMKLFHLHSTYWCQAEFQTLCMDLHGFLSSNLHNNPLRSMLLSPFSSSGTETQRDLSDFFKIND